MTELPGLLRQRQIAEYFDKPYSTVRSWRRRKLLPKPKMIEGHAYWRVSVIKEWKPPRG